MSAGPLLAPGVYSSQEQRAAPVAADSATVLAVVGLSERGPMDEDTLSSDFEEFLAQHGGYTAWNLETVGPIEQYFKEGGKALRFCRTCHHSDPTNPASKTSAKASKTLQTSALTAGSGSVLTTVAAPYNLEPGATLVASIDGGGNATATFNAAAAERTSANGPYALSNGLTLLVSINGGPTQTIVFSTGQFVSIGAATPAEVAASINGQLANGSAIVAGSAVKILSDRRGTSSGVNVSGGTANAGILAFTTGNVAGSGNVADIDAVTGAEVKTVFEGAVAGSTVVNEGGYQRFRSNTTGGSSSIQISATSTAELDFGLDTALHTGNAAGAVATLRIDAKSDGSYGNEIVPAITAPSNGISGFFNLSVVRNGVTLETFANLTMLDTHERYVERIVNDPASGSLYIAAVDLDAATSFPLDAPAVLTTGVMTGGSDGLASLDDNDFIGGSSSNGQVGFRHFDDVAPSMLAVPQRATPAVHAAMVAYCLNELDGKCFPLLDPPAGYSSTQVETYFTSTASLQGLSENGAFYWPRIKYDNPRRSLYGESATVVIPPSGLVAGLAARGDARRFGGQFDQPAGSAEAYLPRSVRGVENDAVNKKTVRDRLAPLGINCIRNVRGTKGGPVFVDGSDVLRQDGSFPSVGQRRGVNWVRQELDVLLEPYGHRGITPDLLRDMAATGTAFLRRVTDGGNLASRIYEEAFFVDFGSGLNKASTKRTKQTRGRFGLATSYPNKFTVYTVGPDTRALDAELAAES